MFFADAPLPLVAAMLACLLQLAGVLRIVLAVLTGRARPNWCSWLIWSVVASLAAASSWGAGATWPVIGAVASAIGCVLILLLCRLDSATRPTRTECACLVAAGLGLLAWTLTRDPVAGLVLFLMADACGAVPTIGNALRRPEDEDLAGWALLCLSALATVASVELAQWHWSWQGIGWWGAAAHVLTVDLLITFCVLVGRLRRAGRPDLVALPLAPTAGPDGI